MIIHYSVNGLMITTIQINEGTKERFEKIKARLFAVEKKAETG